MVTDRRVYLGSKCIFHKSMPRVIGPEVIRPEVVRPDGFRPEGVRPEVVRPEGWWGATVNSKTNTLSLLIVSQDLFLSHDSFITGNPPRVVHIMQTKKLYQYDLHPIHVRISRRGDAAVVIVRIRRP